MSRALSVLASAALSAALLAGPLPSATASPAPAEQPRMAPEKARAIGLKAVKLAKSRKGKPYAYGASGPGSFDCSGLVRWVYSKHLRFTLPHSSAGQYRRTKHISKAHARPGDLVFFRNRTGSIYHVGILATHHRIWHAPHSGTRVRLQKIWTNRYVVGRVAGHVHRHAAS